jgi:endonuclease/exonuclease/phosphatase family metal-dependent hydrolase
MARWGVVRVRLRTAMVLSALVATAVLAVPRPAPADTRLRFFDFNMCGASCNDGDLGKVVTDIADRILAFRPHVATLNEACQGQVQRLEDQLRARGWRMGHVFRTQRHDDRCSPVGGKRLFGDAVLSAAPLGAKTIGNLPQSAGGWEDNRAVLCVNVRLTRDVLACVVHLEANAPKVNAKQVTALARFIKPRAAKGPVVLAGDFNKEPGRLDPFNDPRRGGQFVDAAGGKITGNGKKIDYIFLSRDHFSDVTGGVKGAKYSDHRALYGSANLR